MKNFDFFNNYADAVCVFSGENEPVFENNVFKTIFSDLKTIERFKKRFNFNWCILSSDDINQTPIDVLLNSKENFHTIASYDNSDGSTVYFYIYSFINDGLKFVFFKDVSSDHFLNTINKRYAELRTKYDEIKNVTDKFSKMQEHAQSQVLKMGIINRISLVIRETNDIETILSYSLKEIHSLLGSFKTYFSVKEKNKFNIRFVHDGIKPDFSYCEYEKDVIEAIKKKDIISSPCLKECVNSEKFFNRGVTRIIIPVHNKNKLLGIIVTFTKQKVSVEDNREILQSVAVQLSSSIIQSGLILQLNKKNKKLEKTLNELKTTQLQLINSEKMASLGQLISGVAHEINTPLASISSNNNLIKKILSFPDKISREQIAMISELNSIDIEAAKRISDIVKSLKKFVRLDEAEFQQADINKELDLTLKLIEHETKNKITVIKKYSQLPPVYCAVNMLNQVFMNILINACQNIKEYKTEGKIIITTAVSDGCLLVKIKDDGTGIPVEIQSKIFNTGFTTKKTRAGMGLGLAISKKIIEMHKGSIMFNSTEGKGTEFIVSVPI